MKKNLTTMLLVLSVLSVVSTPCVLAHTDIPAEQARDLIDSTDDLTIVDVRDPYEYCDIRGHIPGALNYPWSSGVLQARYEELSTHGSVLVVCQSGGRSNQAANFLDSKGFTMVYDMLGGMTVWQWETSPCKYGGGTGDPNDPYQIATAADLIALSETPEDYGKHFILTADIDLDPNLPGRKVFDRAVIAPDTNDVSSWFEGTAFTGTFDGDGHTIPHLTITGASYLGLFGQLALGAEVRNLGVVDAGITGTGTDIGVLAGANYGGLVTRCYSSGVVNGDSCVGGLVGLESTAYPDWNRGGMSYEAGRTVTDCYSVAAVSAATGNAGGLVGYNDNGTIIRCYATGPVTATTGAGGLVGCNLGTVTNCYSIGPVKGIGTVGGLVGEGSPTGVLLSVWDVGTSGLSGSAGGAGLTTAEMMDAHLLGLNGFADDPNWVLDAGHDYPGLTWQARPGTVIAEPDIDWLDGLGTAEDPYRIDTAEQLILLGKAGMLWDKHFVLGTDIDLDPNLPNSQVFGQAVISLFTGVFGGDGHTISHLTIEGGSYLGLFGQLEHEAEVRDLGVVDVRITGSGDFAAGLAASNNGIVTECYSTGTVSGGSSVGGLVGNNSGTVTACYSTGVISGDSSVGGLLGGNGGRLIHCYSVCAVAGNESVGGLVGINYRRGLRPILGTTDCFWDIDTSGQATSAGGDGKTTAEMHKMETFLKWGICDGKRIWTINEGHDYPRLWWEGVSGQPIEIDLSELVEGDGTPEHPYVIYTLEDVNTIAMFPCEQQACFLLGFVAGAGTASDPYVIDTAEDLDLLAQCRYEQDKQFRLGFVEGEGTPEEPYIIRTAEDINLLARCPYEQDRHFRLGFVEGNGTLETPYLIHTADELDMIGLCPYQRDAAYRLMSDIDLSGLDGQDGRPAMHVIGSFAGIFDGNGHTLSHLVIQGGNNPGLFGQLASGAEVRDLGMVDVNITGSSSYAGGLIGQNQGSVIRCYSTGAVSGSWSVGGLVGSNLGAVNQCYSTATVTGAATAGLSVGGLVGWNSGTLSQCYSIGPVSGRYGYTGGLTGRGDWQAVQCFWDMQTSGQAGSVGGTGKTTSQMQMAGTFLQAGWDLAGETANGTEDIWWIDEGSDYPRLAWEFLTPHDGARDVSRSPILRWRPGEPGLQYDIYFGDDEAAVSSATPASPGLYCGRQPAEAATCEPGSLVWGKTYYWRIDEINTAADSTVTNGDIWSFTVEPYDCPISSIKATASSSSNIANGPEKTIDGSGLNALDQHSASASQMWLSVPGMMPVWIQYEFDNVYALSQMWVWNSNMLIEAIIGFGARDVTVA